MPNTVQLPDLLSIASPFDLRTNPHCYTVSNTSAAWFTSLPVLTDAERAALPAIKPGLWASVCFPTCDPPQLRLVSDFVAALLVADDRFVHGQPVPDGELAEDPLFEDIIRRILAAPSSPEWRTRFKQSCAAYRAAARHLQSGTTLDADAYIPLRRALSGLPLLFDLLELAEDLSLPSNTDTWLEAKQAAADVVALSLDIMAYNTAQHLAHPANLVAVLTATAGLTPQAAINTAWSAHVQPAAARFASACAALRGPPPSPAPAPTTPGWGLWPRGAPIASPPPPPPALTRDEALYLRGLEDFIAGTLYWAYESEVYFARKGDEVRKFGWVFLRERGEV